MRETVKGAYIPTILAVLLVTGMTAAAELLHNPEILFPEIAAIAAGALLAPRFAWRTDGLRIFVCITIGAFLGVGIVRFVPLPHSVQMSLALLLASGMLLCSRTSFAPMLSAVVLPVMLHTESLVYPAAAMALTLLILGARKLTELLGIRETNAFQPLSRPSLPDVTDLGIRWLIGTAVILLALGSRWKFAAAPPLLVAFTEFWKLTSPAQKHPVRIGLLIAGCALIGAVMRFGAMQTGLPLFIAAGVTMLLVCLLMQRTGMFVPPAAALSVLSFLIPAEAVGMYPLQIAAGTALLVGIAYLRGILARRRQPSAAEQL